MRVPAMLTRLGLRAAAAAAGAQGLLILTYHRVLPEPDPLLPGEPDVAAFAAQMAFLRAHLTPIGLADGVAAVAAGQLPPGAVAVTFDDGYANNATCALPVLLRYGVPATVFVATGLLDGGLMFNDALLEVVRHARGRVLDARVVGLGSLPVASVAERLRAFAALAGALKYRPAEERSGTAARLAAETGVNLPRDLMLTAGQVAALSTAGIDLGGHTRTHPILAQLRPPDARAEIEGCYRDLHRLTGRAPVAFAYPNGVPGQDFTPEHVGMVRAAGYRLACATRPGIARGGDDAYTLPRATLWSSAPWPLVRNVLSLYASSARRRRAA